MREPAPRHFAVSSSIASPGAPSLGRSAALALLLGLAPVAVLGGLSGCASTPAEARVDDALTVPDRVTLNTELRDDDDPAAPADVPASALAERALRDVDDFLRLRDEGVASGTARTAEPAPPRIQWNEHGAVTASAARRPDAAGSSAPTEPPVNQSALFRDPPPPIEVREPPAAGAPGALGGLTPDQTDMLLLDLRRELFRKSIDSDQPMRELLAIAFTSFLDPDTQIDPEAFRDLTEEEREVLEELHTFFGELGRRLDGARPAEQVITEAVDALRDALAREPQLTLPTVALCWQVNGFGDYLKLDHETFLAHDETRVILYLEIEQFTSETNSRGEWVTEVSQQLEIYADADGLPVWSEDWQKAVDVARKQRRDFFTVQIITLPRALGVGRYHMKIRVRDEKSGALAEASIPFEVVADPRMAVQHGQPGK